MTNYHNFVIQSLTKNDGDFENDEDYNDFIEKNIILENALTNPYKKGILFYFGPKYYKRVKKQNKENIERNWGNMRKRLINLYKYFGISIRDDFKFSIQNFYNIYTFFSLFEYLTVTKQDPSFPYDPQWVSCKYDREVNKIRILNIEHSHFYNENEKKNLKYIYDFRTQNDKFVKGNFIDLKEEIDIDDNDIYELRIHTFNLGFKSYRGYSIILRENTYNIINDLYSPLQSPEYKFTTDQNNIDVRITNHLKTSENLNIRSKQKFFDNHYDILFMYYFLMYIHKCLKDNNNPNNFKKFNYKRMKYDNNNNEIIVEFKDIKSFYEKNESNNGEVKDMKSAIQNMNLQDLHLQNKEERKSFICYIINRIRSIHTDFQLEFHHCNPEFIEMTKRIFQKIDDGNPELIELLNDCRKFVYKFNIQEIRIGFLTFIKVWENQQSFENSIRDIQRVFKNKYPTIDLQIIFIMGEYIF